MQPTVAYLILSHHLPGLAARRVGALQHPRAVFCLHGDAKASLKPYLDALPAPLPENVFFLDQYTVSTAGHAATQPAGGSPGAAQRAVLPARQRRGGGAAAALQGLG